MGIGTGKALLIAGVATGAGVVGTSLISGALTFGGAFSAGWVGAAALFASSAIVPPIAIGVASLVGAYVLYKGYKCMTKNKEQPDKVQEKSREQQPVNCQQERPFDADGINLSERENKIEQKEQDLAEQQEAINNFMEEQNMEFQRPNEEKKDHGNRARRTKRDGETPNTSKAELESRLGEFPTHTNCKKDEPKAIIKGEQKRIHLFSPKEFLSKLINRPNLGKEKTH